MRLSFEERIPILQRIADDPDAAPADRMKAVEMMAKYGLGTVSGLVDGNGNDVTLPVVVLPAVGAE